MRVNLQLFHLLTFLSILGFTLALPVEIRRPSLDSASFTRAGAGLLDGRDATAGGECENRDASTTLATTLESRLSRSASSFCDASSDPPLHLCDATFSQSLASSCLNEDDSLPDTLFTKRSMSTSEKNKIIILSICLPSILLLFGISIYLERSIILKHLRRESSEVLSPIAPCDGDWTDLPRIEPVYLEDLGGREVRELPPVYRVDARPRGGFWGGVEFSEREEVDGNLNQA